MENTDPTTNSLPHLNVPVDLNGYNCRKEIETWFTPEKHSDGPKAPTYHQLHNAGRAFALLLSDILPSGRLKDLALERLQESVHWAESSIARD